MNLKFTWYWQAATSFFIYSAVMAAAAIANIVKSSLGPVGLDKMLVDDIGVCLALYPNQIDMWLLI